MRTILTPMGALFSASSKVFNLTRDFVIYEILPNDALFDIFDEGVDEENKPPKVLSQGIDIGPILKGTFPLLPPSSKIEETPPKTLRLFECNTKRQVSAVVQKYPFRIIAYPWNENYYVSIVTEFPAKDLVYAAYRVNPHHVLRLIEMAVARSIEMSELRPVEDYEIREIRKIIERELGKNKLTFKEISWERVFFDPKNGVCSRKTGYDLNDIQDYFALTQTV